MKIFLTGATGYLGTRLLSALRSEGHGLRVLVRDPERLPPEMRDDLEVVVGDLAGDPDPVFFDGVEALIHAGAMVRTWHGDRSLFDRVNVQGYRSLLEVALKAGVPKILHTSSFIALGPSPDGRPMDEETPHWGGPPMNDYERTKRAAEELTREFVDRGAPVISLYPAVVYGPGPCTDGNLLGKLAYWIRIGRFPGLLGSGRQRWTLAFIDDVVRGHLLALQKGRPGDRFILGGPEVVLSDLVGRLQELLERPRGVRTLPIWLGKTIGGLQVLRARLGGPVPDLTPGVAEVYRHDWIYSSGRARETLGYTSTPLETALETTVRWVSGLQGWGDRGGAT
jgi:farnesol dehydrogenase